jgi:hypothetical protein
MSLFYKIVAIASLGLYAASGFLGWEFSGPERGEIPTSARQSPGGYKSFHFWHSGIHGGK